MIDMRGENAMKSISAAIIILAGVAAYAAGATNAQHMSAVDLDRLEAIGGWLIVLGLASWLMTTCAAPLWEWIKARRPKT